MSARQKQAILGNVMRESEAVYVGRRAIQETVAAQEATCEAARQRHAELAEMYRWRAAGLGRSPVSRGTSPEKKLPEEVA